MAYNDIPDGFTLVCNRCGAKFNTFYYDRGSIDHSNKTSDWNLNALIARGEFEEVVNTKYDNESRKCAMIWYNERMKNCSH